MDAATMPPPAEPLDVWRRAGETVGGLAADFAAEASHVRWHGDLLEATIPGSAATAITFLRRPQTAASLAAAASEIAGRAVKTAVIVDENVSAPAPEAPSSPHESPPRRPAASQSALVREAMDHPFVVHARQVFDAAIRKVEPPRQPPAPSPSGAEGGGDADVEAVVHAEDGDG